MSRLDIGRRVDEHVRPDTPALQGFAFARCCGFSSASIPHALTGKVGSGSRRFRPHAVAYDLWLPPAGSIRDLHPPPFIHARRTQSPYGLLPIPPRSLSLPTYSCVDPPPPSTLISRGEVSHRCWHRGGRNLRYCGRDHGRPGRGALYRDDHELGGCLFLRAGDPSQARANGALPEVPRIAREGRPGAQTILLPRPPRRAAGASAVKCW